MYLGMKQQGEWLDVELQCLNTASTPTMPTDVPVLKIWSGATRIVNAEMPIVDATDQVGVFCFPLFLDARFSAGHYTGDIGYTIGTDFFLKPIYFDVSPGGHYDGQVLATAFYHRPNRDHILYQTESGRIKVGSNPRVK